MLYGGRCFPPDSSCTQCDWIPAEYQSVFGNELAFFCACDAAWMLHRTVDSRVFVSHVQVRNRVTRVPGRDLLSVSRRWV